VLYIADVAICRAWIQKAGTLTPARPGKDVKHNETDATTLRLLLSRIICQLLRDHLRIVDPCGSSLRHGYGMVSHSELASERCEVVVGAPHNSDFV